MGTVPLLDAIGPGGKSTITSGGTDKIKIVNFNSTVPGGGRRVMCRLGKTLQGVTWNVLCDSKIGDY
jgi:hypothetical protein